VRQVGSPAGIGSTSAPQVLAAYTARDSSDASGNAGLAFRYRSITKAD
jgi:hypothetical protein